MIDFGAVLDLASLSSSYQIVLSEERNDYVTPNYDTSPVNER